MTIEEAVNKGRILGLCEAAAHMVIKHRIIYAEMILAEGGVRMKDMAHANVDPYQMGLLDEIVAELDAKRKKEEAEGE